MTILNSEGQNALLVAIVNRHPQTTIALLEAGAQLPSKQEKYTEPNNVHAQNGVRGKVENGATNGKTENGVESTDDKKLKNEDSDLNCNENSSAEIES